MTGLQFFRVFPVDYRVLLGFCSCAGSSWGFTGFYWVLLGFTGFYWVSLNLSLMTGLDFAEFFQMITGFYWVSVVVQVLHGVSLGFTGFL